MLIFAIAFHGRRRNFSGPNLIADPFDSFLRLPLLSSEDIWQVGRKTNKERETPERNALIDIRDHRHKVQWRGLYEGTISVLEGREWENGKGSILIHQIIPCLACLLVVACLVGGLSAPSFSIIFLSTQKGLFHF